MAALLTRNALLPFILSNKLCLCLKTTTTKKETENKQCEKRNLLSVSQEFFGTCKLLAEAVGNDHN